MEGENRLASAAKEVDPAVDQRSVSDVLAEVRRLSQRVDGIFALLDRLVGLSAEELSERVANSLTYRLNLARLKPSKRDRGEDAKRKRMRKEIERIEASGPAIAVPEHTSSQFGLFQETVGSPWQLMIACILLNRTRGKTIVDVFDTLIRTWRDPESLASYENAELELRQLLTPLGFQNQRAETIVRFSKEWVALDANEFEGGVPTFKQVAFLHGIGTYALDSYRIFVHPREVRPCDPLSGDPRVFAYCQWVREGMPKLSWAQMASSHRGSGL